MKLLNYFLFVLLTTPLFLACTCNLVAMSSEISRPGFRVITDLSYARSQAVEETDSSDEETDDKIYDARHKPYELDEESAGAAFKRERSARIRSEKKRLITCAACKTAHIIPETENFLVLQKNHEWTCNDIYWQADDVFTHGFPVCAATRIILLDECDHSLDSEGPNSGSDKENQSKNSKTRSRSQGSSTRITYWVSCTNCSAWRIVPAALVKSGKIDMKKLARKANWICADAQWKGPNGFACKH